MDNNVQDDIADICDYKYLINTEHIHQDNMALYRTVDDVIEEYDTGIGAMIVAYRRRVHPPGRLYVMTEDDEYPYIILSICSITYHLSQQTHINVNLNPTNIRK